MLSYVSVYKGFLVVTVVVYVWFNTYVITLLLGVCIRVYWIVSECIVGYILKREVNENKKLF